MKDQEIIEGVIKEFAGLAKCPRPSRHEKTVSDYIVRRLKELGISDVVQDEVYNVIADVPATAGCESMATVIIQGHMDMVCVAKPGVSYDPLTSGITLVRDGNMLRADGTSLGGDDGIAIAVALFLIQRDDVQHGPLRLIFTVDEESGMSGARHLDPKYVQDAQYILNCDSEDINVVYVGSAGGVRSHFYRTLSRQKPEGTQALAVSVTGLSGGHSGMMINTGKGNAVKALAQVLRRLADEGIGYSLASVRGGTAANVIPSEAEAVIVLKTGTPAEAKAVVAAAKAEFDAVYGAAEPKAVFSAEERPVPEAVFSDDDGNAVVTLLLLLHCGVFAMNQKLPGLPDLSANIGTVRTEKDRVAVQYFPRASSDARVREFMRLLTVFAESADCAVEIEEPEPAWAENPDSRLVPLICRIYEQETGRALQVEAMHGALETGFFCAMNPNLDIVSVGPTIRAIHSADEEMDMETVALLVRVIAKMLPKLP